MPGAAIPGILAPTIFFLGLTSVFGHLTLLPGFGSGSYQSFLIPVSLMQGAAFTGAATGVNLARDIEQGWFDRLLASPAPETGDPGGTRPVGWSAGAASGVVPAGRGFAGAHWPGLDGLAVALVVVMGMAVVAATWGTSLALRFRTQSAAPLMQAGMFLLVLFTTAYAPLHLLQGWLQTVARINPVTHVVEAARQGFVGSVTWGDTWPGLLALLGLGVLFTAWRCAACAA